MSPIEIVYKTMYNHFVKKDGYNSTSHVIAAAATCLCNIFFLMNGYLIINILINKSMISFSFTKLTGFLIIAILMALNHALLFKVLKFSKKGDGPNNLFNLEKSTRNMGWWIFGINTFLAILLPIIGGFVFK